MLLTFWKYTSKINHFQNVSKSFFILFVPNIACFQQFFLIMMEFIVSFPTTWKEDAMAKLSFILLQCFVLLRVIQKNV